MRGTAFTWWTSEIEEKVEMLKTIENLHTCFEAQFGITEAEKDAAEDLLNNLVQDAPAGETIRTYAERVAALCRQARVSRNNPKILKKFKKGIFNETIRTILATKTYSSLDEIVKEAEKLAHANSPNSSNAVATGAFTPPTVASVAQATATALYAPATPPQDLEEGLQQLFEVGALDSTSCVRCGVTALVDLGADVSLLSEKAFQILLSLRPSLRTHFRQTDVHVNGEGNSPLNVTGYINLSLSSFARLLRHTLFVCSNLNYAAILGMDFLTRNAESQSFQESKLVLHPRELGLDPEEIPLFPLSTLQKDAACLPAPLVTAAREVLAPHMDALPAHLLIGNSVANVEDRELTLNVVNVSGRYAQIPRGAPLAIATLCEVITKEDEGAEEQALPPPFVSATTSAAATGGSTLYASSMSALGQTELKGGETGGQNPVARPDKLTEEEKEKAEAEIDKALEDCKHLSAKQKKELRDLLLEYRELFPTDRNPGNIKGVEARVDVETDIPIYERPRPVPHVLRAELREGLQKLLEGGIIKPTSSPWGFPLVLIWKKIGKLRICIDYRKLNKIFHKDR
uniref:Peptidase A2 domain-containing protein n=1 Tax=Chromera velia CCMP2878 TaxID=1169474 RepID=A0A0G4G1A0_9ALVE|eukprot:Cvel_19715.t1-p1 / transcript=Cvel_19715.t1 / gene=Cvel_19715 / organism=Chromera_velia_CCMP2878 / gene_product=hypothetical protein / transcript_product=hypothetical protein / location=Cvel_scaffold1722:3523-6533(-) / protein_length=571 / sequence_SO=supercontig / SO=protein_coding / is_pseudo=false